MAAIRHVALQQFGHIPILLGKWEDEQETKPMGFLTELFARPRANETQRYRAALTMLEAMSNRDRADIGIKPADFPRIAREMAIR
jgi:uncharacterized protein YjiS (DUF1127 family)